MHGWKIEWHLADQSTTVMRGRIGRCGRLRISLPRPGPSGQASNQSIQIARRAVGGQMGDA